MEEKAALQKFPVAFRTQRTVKQMEREDLVTEVQFRERERGRIKYADPIYLLRSVMQENFFQTIIYSKY